MEHVLSTDRAGLYSRTQGLNSAEARAFGRALCRRCAGSPLQHVTGEQPFRSITLRARPDVFIPRPETEIVVERCLVHLDGLESPAVLDVGTGTGAIALAIADERPGARVTAIDASDGALELARENAARTELSIELERRDLFADFPAGPWDLVASNPPYVEPDDLHSLMPDVRDWEPHEALVGHGAIEAVARGACTTLRPRGALVVEVGEGQATRVASLLRELGFADVAVTADLAGRDRVVEGVR